MSIRTKIIYGYTLALGIALSGTATGLLVGNHYQHKALELRQIASRERKLISALQVDILYNRPAKQLTPYVQDPEGFQRESTLLLGRIEQIRALLAKHNNAGQPATLAGLQEQLDAYELAVIAFAQKTEQFTSKLQPLTTQPNRVTEAEKLVVELVKSPEFVSFIEFPDQLSGFAKLAESREESTEVELSQAERLRTQIILAGLGLSVAIAVLLSFYTSRAIALPIQAVTDVAQQVSQDSNFELQAPVETNDEVGVLARTLNKLINRVRQLLEEQQKYTQQLEAAKASADAANQAKSEFLANMSHELRTPLNGVLGYSQILARIPMSAEQQRGIEIIYQCGSHLLTLINDVLDIAKIEARKLELQFSPCYFPSLLQGVVEVARIKAEQKSLDFIYHQPENLPTGIVTDEKRLRQVLLNLLGNAIKFTDRGNVTLQLDLQSINSASAEPAIALNFLISDTGIGIDADALDHIFIPFEQVGSLKRQSEGTGLGLAISQKIVEMMGSQIQVASQLATGSSFQFTIICPLAQDWVAAHSLTNLGRITGYTGKRRQILIVDDRWENRSVLACLLEPLGFDLSAAEHGEEALEKIKHKQPDLIITDLKMPIMDGFALMACLRKSEEFKDIPVIVCSSNVFDADRQSSIMAGGDDFLPKPLQAEELYQLLGKHLKLDWSYSDSSAEVTTSTRLKGTDIGEFALPPKGVIEDMLSFAMQGQIDQLKTSLVELLEENSDYKPFVQYLQPLVDNFNIVRVRSFLQKLETSSSS